MHASTLCRTFLCLSLALAGRVGPGCAAALAQAAGSDYTTSLPSVQKVETQLQGTDPADTAARQVAVFEYLQTYIQRIKSARDFRGPYTPGETQKLTDYAKAQYDLTQSFKASHTPAEFARFGQLEGNYSVNNALDWIKQLEGAQAADTYRGAEASLAQTYQQHEDKLQQDMKQANSQANGGSFMDGFYSEAGPRKLSPEQNRCLELGGKFNACAGAMTGLVKGLANVISLGAMDDEQKEQPPLSGVVLVGTYHSRTDLPEVSLGSNGGMTLSKCGTLVDATHPYTIRKSGATTQIVAENEPNPIVLTLQPDGSLSGPGSIQVKGSIITGYNNQYSCTNSTPYTHGNCTTTSTPIYAASMQRCTLSQFAAMPPPPPPPKPKGLIGEVGDMFGMDDPVAAIYGFRMAGPYASSSGMLLSFENGFVTLDCGKAHINAPYTVDNTASGFVVHVQNVGGAFVLGVAPDTTLRGSGSTTVNGRLVASVTGASNVTFTPHSESCNVGTFAPKGKRNTMLAGNGPMPSVAAYAAAAPVSAPETVGAAPLSARRSVAPASANPVAAPVEPTAIQASTTAAAAPVWAASVGPQSIKLAITASFPAGANPLAGHAVMLMSDRFDNALRKAGGPVPEGTTPGKALAAYSANCMAPRSCPSITPTLNKFFVGRAMFDNTGKVVMDATVAPGTYYVFSSGNSGGGVLVWDLPVEVKSSGTAVTLQASNAEVVK